MDSKILKALGIDPALIFLFLLLEHCNINDCRTFLLSRIKFFCEQINCFNV